MEKLENINVKTEDVKEVLNEEGIQTEAVKALAGTELTDEDLKELVGGLSTQDLKNLAFKGLKYGAYTVAGLIAVGSLAAAEYHIDGKEDSYTGKAMKWTKNKMGYGSTKAE